MTEKQLKEYNKDNKGTVDYSSYKSYVENGGKDGSGVEPYKKAATIDVLGLIKGLIEKFADMMKSKESTATPATAATTTVLSEQKTKPDISDLVRENNSAAQPKWPTDSRRITWEFGKAHPLGIDIGDKIKGVAGDEIRASMGGKIKIAGYPEWSPSGSIYIVIDGNDGREYQYVHTDNFTVKEGDVVSTGTKLSTMSDKRPIGGAHLHYGIRENGKSINPLTLLPK